MTEPPCCFPNHPAHCTWVIVRKSTGHGESMISALDSALSLVLSQNLSNTRPSRLRWHSSSPACSSRPTCTVAGNTPELWTKVFAHVETAQMGYRTWNDIEDDQQNQRRLHQLRLVCKQVNEVFAAQPLFLKRLSLPKAFPISSVPSLLGWLQQSKDCAEVLEANCACPTVDVVLGALTSIRSQLKLVSVLDASTACSMQLLGSFSSLETCTLSSLRGSLNLTPLQALPKLRSLWLAGDFDGLASLSHLTHIQCLAGFLDCTGSCKFGRTLQQLDVERTIFENFDISVCQGLQVLKLDLSRVIHHHSLMYASGPPITPVGLSLLTKLETLSPTSSLTSCDYISLAWINELTTQHQILLC